MNQQLFNIFSLWGQFLIIPKFALLTKSYSIAKLGVILGILKEKNTKMILLQSSITIGFIFKTSPPLQVIRLYNRGGKTQVMWAWCSKCGFQGGWNVHFNLRRTKQKVKSKVYKIWSIYGTQSNCILIVIPTFFLT